MVSPLKPATFPVYDPTSIAKKATSGSTPGAGSITSASSALTGGVKGPSGSLPGIAPQAPEKVDFSEKLREVLNETNQTQVKAETAAEDYASGKQNDLHGTMISMTEADVSLRLVSNVRSRVIEAYREVMRMGS
jgi:flagellar hook-basal body complex protein FliE